MAKLKADIRVDYKKLQGELDAILVWFESDEVELDQAIAKYERGMEITKELEKYLKTAENKIEIVKKKFDA